jgi:hypothetical protein
MIIGVELDTEAFSASAPLTSEDRSSTVPPPGSVQTTAVIPACPQNETEAAPFAVAGVDALELAAR